MIPIKTAGAGQKPWVCEWIYPVLSCGLQPFATDLGDSLKLKSRGTKQAHLEQRVPADGYAGEAVQRAWMLSVSS